MDGNRKNFNFEEPARLLLKIAYKQFIQCKLKCITSINLFTATFLAFNSPLYQQLIDAKLKHGHIMAIALSMLQETAFIYGFHETFSVLTVGDELFPVSQQVYDTLVKAESIAKNNYKKDTIGYTEIIDACRECMPFLYESLVKKSNISPVINNSLLKEVTGMNIPIDLEGCLTIFNSKFSPDEEDCCILGRDEETRSLLRTLAKDTKRNAVLIGEPGVGKTAIVEKLTWLIVTGNCPAKFKDFIIVSLDINSIISGTHFRGSAEARFKSLIDFLDKNPKCILFIDEIHTLLGAGACREGDLDLANALKPILARDTTQVIGATTLDEYKKYFTKDGALSRRFKPIEVPEPKIHEVYPMIQNQIKRLSKSHGVTISREVVDMVIFYASCFNKETKNPDRSLDLIDLAMATAELAGKKEVSREDVLDNFNLNYNILEKTPHDIKVGLAYHESGHCLVHYFSNEITNYYTTALSIMPAEDYYGAHVYDIDENIIPSRTLNYYIQMIGCKLAGRIAEELYSTNLSAGASKDLDNATLLAQNVITKYGLVDTFSRNRVYLEEKGIPLTSEKRTRLDNEVDYLLTKAEMYVKYIFKHHRYELDSLASTLLEKKMMSGEELDEFFKSLGKVIPTDSADDTNLQN